MLALWDGGHMIDTQSGNFNGNHYVNELRHICATCWTKLLVVLFSTGSSCTQHSFHYHLYGVPPFRWVGKTRKQTNIPLYHSAIGPSNITLKTAIWLMIEGLIISQTVLIYYFRTFKYWSAMFHQWHVDLYMPAVWACRHCRLSMVKHSACPLPPGSSQCKVGIREKKVIIQVWEEVSALISDQTDESL